MTEAPTERPEWVECIARPDRRNEGWCGSQVNGFAFVSLDHAAMNRVQGGRLVACRECVAAAVKALTSGHEFPEYPESSRPRQPPSKQRQLP